MVQEHRLDRNHNSSFPLREKLGSRTSYRSAEVEALQTASELRETSVPVQLRALNGSITLTCEVAGNGLTFLVLRRGKPLR